MNRLVLLLAALVLPSLAIAQDDASSASDDHPHLQLEYNNNPGNHTSYPAVVPINSPLRRVAPAELSCADYSMAYFRRHPAMARVCDVSPQTIEAGEAALAAAVSATTASVSVTQP